MSKLLNDQTVLVVGASSGIGRAVALMAARSGAIVYAAARRQARLDDLQSEIEAENLRLSVHKADATHLDDMIALVDRVEHECGRIDIAVYATGTNSPDRSMRAMTPATWNDIIETNLNGAFYMSHAVLPVMRKGGAGHIIYISSTAGVIADLSGAAYQASKRGMVGLAHAIRLEESSAGIRTCCIMPGLTNTELVEKRPEKLPSSTLEKALQPDDVASMILHVMCLPSRVTIPELLMVPSRA
ncbi:MAG: SDR family oxidoreductase [Granulicella sp.]